MAFEHLPDDIKAALKQFDADIESGKIVPWNPNTRDEYCDDRMDKDRWLAAFMASHLPEMYIRPHRDLQGYWH